MSTWIKEPTDNEDFTVRTLSQQEVQVWYHVYNTRDFPTTASTFARGWGNTRFAPIKLTSDKPVHTYYAASTPEAAYMESVLHETTLSPPEAFDTSILAHFHLATVELPDELRYVSFHSPYLPKLGITRTELVDSPPAAYEGTRGWAQAAFLACADAQALGYGSRRNDAGRCLMLFEQRLPDPPLRVIHDEPLAVGERREEVLTLVRSLGLREL